jgi:hypothetical protein
MSDLETKVSITGDSSQLAAAMETARATINSSLTAAAASITNFNNIAAGSGSGLDSLSRAAQSTERAYIRLATEQARTATQMAAAAVAATQLSTAQVNLATATQTTEQTANRAAAAQSRQAATASQASASIAASAASSTRATQNGITAAINLMSVQAQQVNTGNQVTSTNNQQATSANNLAAANARATAQSQRLTAAQSAQASSGHGVNSSAVSGISSFAGLAGAFSVGALAARALQEALSLVKTGLVAGIKAVDDMQVSVIQIAAQIAQLQGPKDAAKHYMEAKVYAEALALKMQEIDRNSFATNAQLMSMTAAFINHGVLLDINNKKQVESFTALSNSIAMYTRGQAQNMQMTQEVNALMEGRLAPGDKLARQMNEAIIMQTKGVSNLEKELELGKKNGDTLERFTPYLQGVIAASADINGTWGAMTSSLETTFSVIANASLGGPVKEVSKLVLGLMDDVIKYKDVIATGVAKAWFSVKITLETFRVPLELIWDLTKGIAGAVGWLVDLWTLLAINTKPYLIVLDKMVSLIAYDMVVALGTVGQLIKDIFLDGNLEKAWERASSAVESFAARQTKFRAEAAAEGAEVKKNTEAYYALAAAKKKASEAITVPEIGKRAPKKKGGKSGRGDASDMQKWKNELAKMKEEDENFHNDDIQGEIDFWTKKQALTTEGSKKTGAAYASTESMIRSLTKTLHLQQQAELIQHLKSEAALLKEGSEEKLKALEHIAKVAKSFDKRETSKENKSAAKEVAKEEDAVLTEQLKKYAANLEERQKYEQKGVDGKLALIREELEYFKSKNGEHLAIYKSTQDKLVTVKKGASAELESIEKTTAKSIHQQNLAVIADAAADARYRIEIGKSTADKEYAIRLKFLQDTAALEIAQAKLMIDLSKDNPAKKAEELAKLKSIETKFAMDIKQLDRDTNKERMKGYKAVTDQMVSGLSSAFDKMMKKGFTWKEFYKDMLNNMISGFSKMIIKKAAEWVRNAVFEETVTKTKVMTTNAIETAGATTSNSIAAAKATTQVGLSAVIGSAGAYSSQAGIPYVGPILGAAASVAVMAAIMALTGSISSASGGYDIPSGVNPMTQLHQNEMVLPAHLAEKIRSIDETGGGKGKSMGNMHVQVNAMDAKSVARVFKQNGAAMQQVLHQRMRDGKR